MRIDPTKKQIESTYQVVLDILKLSPCYNQFLITTDVPQIYMKHVELFCEILRIGLIVPNQEFFAPPPHDSLVTFLKSIGYKGLLEMLSDFSKESKKRNEGHYYFNQERLNNNDENILSDPDEALQLGKSMNLTEAEEQEEARRVHETHKRLVTEKTSNDEEE
ncbi:hypothetical protein Tco_0760139 [Tanacetum coccineum]